MNMAVVEVKFVSIMNCHTKPKNLAIKGLVLA